MKRHPIAFERRKKEKSANPTSAMLYLITRISIRIDK
jgi:hypothetical protein